MIKIHRRPIIQTTDEDFEKMKKFAEIQAMSKQKIRVRVGYVYWPKFNTWAKSYEQAKNNYLYRIGARG